MNTTSGNNGRTFYRRTSSPARLLSEPKGHPASTRCLHQVGMLKTSPSKLIAQGTDWLVLHELKNELKA